MPAHLYAYTYLFESESRAYPCARPDTKHVQVTLPNTDFHPAYEEVTLDVDERDQRALVVFDGDIPWTGLPRSAVVLKQIQIASPKINRDHFRRQRPEEEQLPPSIIVGPTDVTLTLRRHFLLLPAGTALVRRYRARSFAGVYAFVEVVLRDSGPVVTWRNTTA